MSAGNPLLQQVESLWHGEGRLAVWATVARSSRSISQSISQSISLDHLSQSIFLVHLSQSTSINLGSLSSLGPSRFVGVHYATLDVDSLDHTLLGSKREFCWVFPVLDLDCFTVLIS